MKVTLKAKLPDGNNDGVIDVKEAGRKKYGLPHTGLWWLVEHEADFTYTDTESEKEPPKPEPLFGFNLSGGEFETTIMPSKEDIDWYASIGAKIIRFPWSDSVLASPSRITQIAALDAHAKSLGLERIHDRHSYRYATAEAALAFLRPLFDALPDDAMIELANEPQNGYPAGVNKHDAHAQTIQPTITAIRDAGYRHRLLFGWYGWNSIFRLDKREGTTKPSESFFTALDRAGGFRDPLDRTFLSPHRYFDEGGSGGSAVCETAAATSSGVINLAARLRARGLKAYITETAFGSHRGIHDSCAPVGPLFIADVRANADVILGVTWWGAGRAWKEDYHYKIEPKKGTRATTPLSAYTKLLLGQTQPAE